MRNEQTVRARRLGALPGLVLGVVAFTIMFASGARAEDPPVVSVGSVGAGGNTASGSVGSGGKTGACVNDRSSSADPSSSNPDNAAKLNEGSCQAVAGSSAGTGATGSKAGAGGAKSSATAAWVSSSQAVGLRIVRVRNVIRGVTFTKRFRVLVTLRDLRGRYVRNAIVSVSRVPSAVNTISGVHSTFSNRAGQASIGVPVTKSMLGKRLFLKIGARTPKARSITLRSVRLPARG
jgi:hypothetical protein